MMQPICYYVIFWNKIYRTDIFTIWVYCQYLMINIVQKKLFYSFFSWIFVILLYSLKKTLYLCALTD